MNRTAFATLLCSPLLGLAGCYPEQHVVTSTKMVRVVETLLVEELPVDQPLVLYGRVEPGLEVTLQFEVPGIIDEVSVRVGDQVNAGDIIARLDDTDYSLTLARATAEHSAARARLELLQAGTRTEDIAAERAKWEQSRADARFYLREFERTEKLIRDSRTVSESEYFRAKRDNDAAAQQEQAAKAAYDRAVAGARPEEIEAAAADVAASERAVQIAQRQLDKCILRATFAGRIEKRWVDPGTYVSVFPTGGTPVVHLVDITSVEAVVPISESARPRFAPGDSVMIASATREMTAQGGEILSVGDVADPYSGTYELRVQLDNHLRYFSAGMVVTATLQASIAATAIQVPLSAIRHVEDQMPYVFVVDDTTSQPTIVQRFVELGEPVGQRIVVKSGLNVGDQLVVRGQQQVVPSDVVNVRRFDKARVAGKWEGYP